MVTAYSLGPRLSEVRDVWEVGRREGEVAKKGRELWREGMIKGEVRESGETGQGDVMQVQLTEKGNLRERRDLMDWSE